MSGMKEHLMPLMNTREGILAQEKELREQLDERRDERRVIEKVLKAGGLLEVQGNGHKAKKRSAVRPPAEETVDKADRWLNAFSVGDRETFTRAMLMEGIGCSDKTGDKVIDLWRSQNRVALKGTGKGGGRLYRPVNNA